ncbi:MAG: histidine phosphatase family protein [Paracoccaceae bacterium]
MRLLLVRHGQSEWNAARILQGQADIPLSDLGRRQADALAPVIAALKPERAITSDLARAQETAERLGYGHARLEPGLREIDVGIWQGRSIPELQADSPGAYEGWRAGNHRPDGGEEWGGFLTRVEKALHAEIRAGAAKTLLVVCHGGVIRAAVQVLVGLVPARILPASPASLTCLKVGSTEKTARLELYNYRPGQPELGTAD